MKTIGIIGGGASGALTALHCWKELKQNCQILIFESESKLGIGKAYSTENTNYILNVPVSNMSIFLDHSDNFEEWVLNKNPDLKKSVDWPYVPRFYFASYLQFHLKKIPEQNFTHIQTRIESIGRQHRHYVLTSQHNKKYKVDYLILATGFNTKNSTLSYQSSIKNSCIHNNDDAKYCDPAKLNGKVFIIGTGLSAIDIWRRLRENKNLKFTFISRHGFLPFIRTESSTYIKLPRLSGLSPLQILQVLRTIQESHQYAWSQLADALQWQIQKIWTCWTAHEKNIFLKYLAPYWETIRHQMPSSVASVFNQDIKTKKVNIYAGKIQSIIETESGIHIQYLDRKNKTLQTKQANHLFFAIGPKIDTNLIQNSKIPGIQICANNFGYIATNAPRLWCVGPAAKSQYYEITSVPFIRTQTQKVASEISNMINSQCKSLRIEYFKLHPRAAGETYLEHFWQAFGFARYLFKQSAQVFTHALFPFLYTDKTSACIRDLGCVLSKRRQRTTHHFNVESKPQKPTLAAESTHQNHEASLHHQNHQQIYHQ